MQKRVLFWLNLALCLALAPLLTSCAGNGQSLSQNPPGKTPEDILNGNTLSTADSHWVAQNCSVQVELTADKGAWTVVRDTGGNTSSGSESWTQGSTTDSVDIGPGSGLGGFFWISTLTSIRGSTLSKSFSAGVTVEDSTQTHQSLGSCSFTLQSGGLP
jgi:hypothetical protein